MAAYRFPRLLMLVLFGIFLVTNALWSETFEVRIRDNDFNPRHLDIRTGDTVMWVNDDGSGRDHTTTNGDPFDPFPGSVWDSGPIPDGGSFSVTFNSPGDFDYFCTEHPLIKFGNLIVGGTGVQVAFTPRNITNVRNEFETQVTVYNFTPQNQSGDLWFTIVIPGGQEIVVPAANLSFPTNPISGTVTANNKVDFSVLFFVPGGVAAGHYEMIARVGTYPATVADETSFEFDIP